MKMMNPWGRLVYVGLYRTWGLEWRRRYEFWTRYRLGPVYALVYPSRGDCAVCGKPVFHVYPWWTKNPERCSDAEPMHDECAKERLFEEDGQ